MTRNEQQTAPVAPGGPRGARGARPPALDTLDGAAGGPPEALGRVAGGPERVAGGPEPPVKALDTLDGPPVKALDRVAGGPDRVAGGPEPPAAELARADTAHAERLASESLAPNTRRAYRGAVEAFDRSGLPESDAGIAVHLARLDAEGRAPASARMAAAALRCRARLDGRPDPLGPGARRVLAGLRRAAAGRGRGQAPAMTPDDLAAIAATAAAPRPSRNGRGVESPATAARRGRLDVAIAGLLFHGGLRRSEVGRLLGRDVEPATGAATALVRVRRSKTNPNADRADVRLVKGPAAEALLELARAAGPEGRVIPLGPAAVQARLQAAATAAGITRRLTGHSGRVGLASELTARGASTADVMLAGGWRSAAMVAQYSAGAAAERGAVARLL